MKRRCRGRGGGGTSRERRRKRDIIWWRKGEGDGRET